jgi:hypothetical protein
MVCGVGGGGGQDNFFFFPRIFRPSGTRGAQLLCDRRGVLIFSPTACALLQPSRVIALKLRAE